MSTDQGGHSPDDAPARGPASLANVTICRGPEMVEVIREPHGQTRWCFQCRKRTDFVVVCKRTKEISYWGPVVHVACAEREHVDGDLFPDGREREWDV